jgi:hypothetical protein
MSSQRFSHLCCFASAALVSGSGVRRGGNARGGDAREGAASASVAMRLLAAGDEEAAEGVREEAYEGAGVGVSEGVRYLCSRIFGGP